MEELAKYARHAPDELSEDDVKKLADVVLQQQNKINDLKQRLRNKKRKYSREKNRRWRDYYSPS